MKAALVGSVEFSRRMLHVLLDRRPDGVDIAAVLGMPPQYSKGISDYADLAPAARAAGAPYRPFHKINSPGVAEVLAEARPDYTFIFGLSQLLSPETLALAGTVIGTHPTLLPDGRGRAAVPWSILLGWRRSGITFFGITEGVDDGPLYEQEPWDIGPRDDAEALYGKMCDAGEKAFERLLRKMAAGTLVGVPQGTPRIGPLPRRRPEDGRVDWSMTAEDIDRLIRATTRPYPGAYCEVGDGFPSRRLILWKSGGVATGSERAPGTVVGVDDAGFVVAASGGAVRVSEAEFEGTGARCGAGAFTRVFREGQRLVRE